MNSDKEERAEAEAAAAPKHILIIGAGVFGLTTALAISKRAVFQSTRITLLDPHTHVHESHAATTSSVDISRIVRADYADPYYAQLALDAEKIWPQYNEKSSYNETGEQRYFNSGIVITADPEKDDYLNKSLANCLQLEVAEEASSRPLEKRIRVLRGVEEIGAAISPAPGTAKGTGTKGYYNPTSAWVHAESSMKHLWREVQNCGRVEFVVGTAAQLVRDETSRQIIGAELKDGRAILDADVTIVAAGAWSPALVDLRGVASARAQCLGYVQVNKEEGEHLQDLCVHLNISTGLALFPLNKGEVKLLAHAYGYTNPVEIPAPVDAVDEQTKTIVTSLPAPDRHRVPAVDATLLAGYLQEALPILSKTRSLKEGELTLSTSKLCWYLDTKSSDFLVCWHPSFIRPDNLQFPGSLFLAAGGSGHGFKFLPVLGERIVDVLTGTDLNRPSSNTAISGTNGLWTRKWSWPGRQADDEVWCEDGSRAGKKGLKLEDAKF